LAPPTDVTTEATYDEQELSSHYRSGKEDMRRNLEEVAKAIDKARSNAMLAQ